MTKICLLVLIGLPAAGKTSFCRKFLCTPAFNSFKIVHFCYDDFLDVSLFEDAATISDATYKIKRQEILNTIETIIINISNKKEIPEHLQTKINICNDDADKKECVFLLDDNHFYHSMRYKLYQLCNKHACGFGQFYFECDLRTSVLRNTAREHCSRLPTHVIEGMAKRLEAPSENNHWENLTFKIYNGGHEFFSPDLILNFIQMAFKNVPKNEAENILSNNEKDHDSLIHNLDIMLRRRISELLQQEIGKHEKQCMAVQYNLRRKEILKYLRNIHFEAAQLDEFVEMLNNNKILHIES